MAQTSTEQYSSRKMAVIFAVCSLVSLILLGVVMYQSTHSEWREHQEVYKELAIRKAETRAEAMLAEVKAETNRIVSEAIQAGHARIERAEEEARMTIDSEGEAARADAEKAVVAVKAQVVASIAAAEAQKELRVEQAQTQAAAMIAAAEQFQVNLKDHQLYLTELDNRIDRCTTCHVGIDSDVVTADSPDINQNLVLARHPRKEIKDAAGNVVRMYDYLKKHPPSRFGCTSCHDGQGLATNAFEAHAVPVDGETVFWEKPMLKGVFLEANCLKCHADNIPAEEAPHLARGKELFESSGCLGCHKLDGQGGGRGPALDGLADASKHTKHVIKEGADAYLTLQDVEHNHNIAFILESIMNPKAQPEDSKMIPLQLPADADPERYPDRLNLSSEDLISLGVYLKGLTQQKVPASMVPRTARRPGLDGEKLYQAYCSACHGDEGEGRIYEEFAKKPPRLGSNEFLSIASRRLLTKTIEVGKTGGVMPAWAKAGGLSHPEIGAIVDYLQSLQGPKVTYSEMLAYEGSVSSGKILFAKNCAACHGEEGMLPEPLDDGSPQKRGALEMVGPSLNNDQYLALAGEEFIFRTIAHGRPETAMPGWRHLGPKRLAHLMAYLRSWRGDPPDEVEVLARVAKKMKKWAKVPEEDREFEERPGEITFGTKCGSCHGEDGEGGIGPSLINAPFQQVADPKFLYRTITQGRPETAMPGYYYLTAGNMANVIAYIKSFETAPPLALTDEPVAGNEHLGKRVFAESCGSCHGDQGQGGIGSGILRRGFLSTATDQFIRHRVLRGECGQRRMPEKDKSGKLKTPKEYALKRVMSRSTLSEKELDGLTAYLRSRERAIVEFPIRATDRGLTPEQKEASITRGGIVYAQQCGACHGQDGGGRVGPSLGNRAFLNDTTDGFILSMASIGRSGTAMPRMGKGTGGSAELPQYDILAVTDYIRQWQTREEVPSRRVLGDAASGERLYANYCNKCHGDPEEEGFAPALNNKDFLATASDGYLQATMVLGRTHTPMQPVAAGRGGMADLTVQEMNDIIVFLRATAAGRRSDGPVPDRVDTVNRAMRKADE